MDIFCSLYCPTPQYFLLLFLGKMRILRTKLNLKHALVSSVVSIVVIAFYVDYKEVYWFFFFLLTGVLCVALAVLELNL